MMNSPGIAVNKAQDVPAVAWTPLISALFLSTAAGSGPEFPSRVSVCYTPQSFQFHLFLLYETDIPVFRLAFLCVLFPVSY